MSTIIGLVSTFRLPLQPVAYREAYAPLLCPFWGVSPDHSPTTLQAQVGSALLTL